MQCAYSYIYHNLCFNPGHNDRILHIAQNFGGGYTSKVFDSNLGLAARVIFDDNYIFAAKVLEVKVSSYNYVAIMVDI